jgi:hypothetical protein
MANDHEVRMRVRHSYLSGNQKPARMDVRPDIRKNLSGFGSRTRTTSKYLLVDNGSLAMPVKAHQKQKDNPDGIRL